MDLKELEIVETSQNLYDFFNGFILSSDTKVFGKLLARTLLVDQVKDYQVILSNVEYLKALECSLS